MPAGQFVVLLTNLVNERQLAFGHEPLTTEDGAAWVMSRLEKETALRVQPNGMVGRRGPL